MNKRRWAIPGFNQPVKLGVTGSRSSPCPLYSGIPRRRCLFKHMFCNYNEEFSSNIGIIFGCRLTFNDAEYLGETTIYFYRSLCGHHLREHCWCFCRRLCRFRCFSQSPRRHHRSGFPVHGLWSVSLCLDLYGFNWQTKLPCRSWVVGLLCQTPFTVTIACRFMSSVMSSSDDRDRPIGGLLVSNFHKCRPEVADYVMFVVTEE